MFGFSLIVIDDVLTTVGGYGADCTFTNKLFSLIGGRRWTEKLPPMPTTRCFVSALCTGKALIVAGGVGDNNLKLKTVEILNTETRQWHTAPDLPEQLARSSLTLCGDLVYLLGGLNKDDAGTNSVHSCSLSSLLPLGLMSLSECLVYALSNTLTRSSKSSTWNRIADLPIKLFTAVTLQGRLLAFGGRALEDKPTTAIHMYQPTTNSWEVISHMTIPRSWCSAVVLPDNQLMVVGGGDKRYEFGEVI